MSSDGTNISLSELSKKAEKDQKQLKILLSLLTNLMVTIAVAITMVAGVGIFSGNYNKEYFPKSIKDSLKTVIMNNGDLDVIKNIYKNRSNRRPNILETFSGKASENNYLVETPLSQILDDMKSDYFLNTELDSIYLTKLNSIITIHRQTNPFDKLEYNQKNDFENVRIKSGNDYIKIQTDIIRIADELHNRNLLVTKYLDRSTISFWISISAVVLTILLYLLQNHRNRPSRLMKLFVESLNQVDKEKEETESDD